MGGMMKLRVWLVMTPLIQAAVMTRRMVASETIRYMAAMAMIILKEEKAMMW